VLTDHQAYTYEALSKEAGTTVIAYVSILEDVERKMQGWRDTRVKSFERHLIPGRGFIRYCYKKLQQHRHEVHLFASPFGQFSFLICMFIAARLGIEFYIVSEPYSPRSDGYLRETFKLLGKTKAALRPLLYRIYVFLLKRSMAGVFAISQRAMHQYSEAGLMLSKLFPFGYFIPCHSCIDDNKVMQQGVDNGELHLIFVGALLRRKGIDILQDAVTRLHKEGVKITVDFYGPGNASTMMRSNPAIKYCGTIPFGEAQTIIQQYDILVLPSRYDGWGVVVNEAICAGVPVVCSDFTGAGNVAQRLGVGLCFTSDDVDSLVNVLSRLYHDRSLLKLMRKAMPDASLALEPQTAARYMNDVIRALPGQKSKIPSPWYSVNYEAAPGG